MTPLPPRHPLPTSPGPRWRMVLGGGLAVLAIWHAFCSSIPKLPRCRRWNLRLLQQTCMLCLPEVQQRAPYRQRVPADTVPLTIPADDLGESTLQIPLEKLRIRS